MRSKSKLLTENRALQQEMTSLQEAAEEEADGRAQALKMLTKANGEAQMWKRKFEGGDGAVKAEEVSSSSSACMCTSESTVHVRYSLRT